MKKVSVAILGLLFGSGLPGANLAGAADMPDVIPAYAPSWSWTGFYGGVHLGANSASSQFADPAGPSIYGGTVRGPAFLGGGQAGYNWQIPNSNFVLGVEGDISGYVPDGSATCLASSGFFISANCRVHQSISGSLTGRVGWAAGAQGRTLIYAKGGAAVLQERIDITSNPLIFPATTFDGTRWGWTVGGGVERAITPAWSFRLEYDYAKFGALTMATPQSFNQVLPPLADGYLYTAGGTTSVSQNLQTVKVGLNYKMGVDGDARFEPAVSDYRLRGTTDPGVIPGIEIEIGGRTWYSSGRFQKDLGATADQAKQNVLVSRLTYDTTAASGEVFAPVLSTLVRDKKVEVEADLVRLPGRGVRMKDEEAESKEKIETAFSSVGLKVPALTEVIAGLKIDKFRAQKIVTLLLRDKVLIKVSDELVFHRSALDALRRQVAEYKVKASKIDVAKIK